MKSKPRKFYKLMFLRMYSNPFNIPVSTRKRKIVYAKLQKLYLERTTLDILLQKIDEFKANKCKQN